MHTAACICQMPGEMALLVLYAAAWSKKELPKQGYKFRQLGSGCSFLILSLLSVLPSFFPPCHINCCTYTSRYGLLAGKIRLGGIFQPESFLWAVARKMKTSWNINYWGGGKKSAYFPGLKNVRCCNVTRDALFCALDVFYESPVPGTCMQL